MTYPFNLIETEKPTQLKSYKTEISSDLSWKGGHTQVPALIKHPSSLPETIAFKNPEPENVPLVPVEVGAVDVVVAVLVLVLVFVVAVVVETAVPVLVEYFTPLEGQSDVSPTRVSRLVQMAYN